MNQAVVSAASSCESVTSWPDAFVTVTFIIAAVVVAYFFFKFIGD